MNKITLGVIREGKVPPDFRVPLSPELCKKVQDLFPHVTVQVQTSPIRCFKDEDYAAKGLLVQEDMSNCDILLGVKEVNTSDLIPGKKYLFFSHTIKKQPYNRNLLRTILEKKIQLIDYEVIKSKAGKRLIGFGRYAGIVGCYNGFRAYGLKHNLYELKPANQCSGRAELEQELTKIELPATTKIILTGFGRVGNGAREIMELLPIKEVSPNEYLNEKFDEPVFTHLEVDDYFARISDNGFDKKEFYSEPDKYKSIFAKYATESDLYIACHFWNSKSPFIITKQDFKTNSRLKVVADVSCDINGPIACTIRPSKISDPFFGYDPQTESEVSYRDANAVMVMSIDNLPCELPKDASEDFGNELINQVFPHLLGTDTDGIIERASETNLEGELTSYFAYLADYVNGVQVG